MTDSVTISPEVFALMGVHASCHPTTPLHGVLVGNRNKSKNGEVEITDAFPICHESPTKILVETSLSLILSVLEDDNNNKKSIVGWYTAPELLDETKPGPVALRIVASIAAAASATGGEPVLLVLNNDKIVKLFEKEETDPNSCVQAYGKDFGMQWMEPVKSTKVTDSPKAVKAVLNDKLQVKDLVDHWEAGTSSEWTTASSLTKYM